MCALLGCQVPQVTGPQVAWLILLDISIKFLSKSTVSTLDQAGTLQMTPTKAWYCCPRLPWDVMWLSVTLQLIFKVASDALTAKRILNKEHSWFYCARHAEDTILGETRDRHWTGKRVEEHPAARLKAGAGMGRAEPVYSFLDLRLCLIIFVLLY